MKYLRHFICIKMCLKPLTLLICDEQTNNQKIMNQISLQFLTNYIGNQELATVSPTNGQNNLFQEKECAPWNISQVQCFGYEQIYGTCNRICTDSILILSYFHHELKNHTYRKVVHSYCNLKLF